MGSAGTLSRSAPNRNYLVRVIEAVQQALRELPHVA